MTQRYKIARYCGLIIILFISYFSSNAQSFRECLESMKQTYSTLESAHIKMSIRIFENDKSSTPYFDETADIKRQNRNYSYQFGSINMLMNAKYILMVDKSSKEIVCTRRSLKAEEQIERDPFKLNLDSILSFYGTPDYLGKTTDGTHYRFFQKKGTIRQFDFFIDEERKIVNKIEYRYEDKHYVVIRFMLFETHPAFSDDVFDERKFVMEEKGKLTTSGAYRGYHVAVVNN